MTFWLLLTVNSVTFGGLLFLLSAGFSLIFGLMRIPNLTHGSMFMVGAYLGTTFFSGALGFTLNFWVGAILTALEVAVLGALMERLLLRRLAGQQLAQVLVTLGVSFMVADLCLMAWGGDPISVATPPGLGGFIRVGTAAAPLYRLAIIAIIPNPSCGSFWKNKGKPIPAWICPSRPRPETSISARSSSLPISLHDSQRRPDRLAGESIELCTAIPTTTSRMNKIARPVCVSAIAVAIKRAPVTDERRIRAISKSTTSKIAPTMPPIRNTICTLLVWPAKNE